MSLESNRHTILTMWPRFERSLDWALIESIYAPEYVRYGAHSSMDRSLWFEELRELYRAFPEHHTEVPVAVAEGDLVCYEWTATATHSGQFLGAPATGRPVHARGITISRFRDGQIVEERASWNKLELLSDLKILTLNP